MQLHPLLNSLVGWTLDAVASSPEDSCRGQRRREWAKGRPALFEPSGQELPNNHAVGKAGDISNEQKALRIRPEAIVKTLTC